MINATTLNQDGTGALACIRRGNFASTAANQAGRITRTNTALLRWYADDAGVVLTGTGSVPDIRNGLYRTLLTKDNTGGDIRVHSLMGQIKAYDAFWNDEVVSAVHGRIELVRSAATMTLGGNGVTAAVLGIPSVSGAVTVNTNHFLAGVAAVSDFRATLTQTGTVAAFLAAAYDTTNWSDSTARTTWGYGLYVAASAAATGVYIGTATTGISIAGATTTGISIGGASTTGISITGAATDGIKILTGAMTDGIEIASACTKAINISGAMTTGISITGACTTALTVGVTGTKITLAAAAAQVGTYCTSAATTGNIRAVEFDTVLTAASATNTIENFASIVTANVQTGNWCNAILGKVDYSTAGYVTGLAGVICSELDMTNATIGNGSYCCYEAELNIPASGAGYGTGVPVTFLTGNAWGSGVAAWITGGYIFNFTGVGAATTGKIFQANTAAAATHALRIIIDGVPYYMMLTETGA